MGGANSTALDMSEVDFETYTGERYTLEVPHSREAHRGPIYYVPPVAVDAFQMTLYNNFQRGLAMENGTRPCYGTRQVVNGVAGAYAWLTYNDVFAKFEAIAAGLSSFAALKRGSMLGVFSKNRVEWCLTSHAADRQAYTLVPLYDTLGPDAVPYIVNHTELTTMVYAKEQFEVVLQCIDACPTLKYVVQLEDVTPQQREQLAHKGIQLKSLSEIEALGKANPIPADPPRPEDIATICYTSGTTGNPKGVVLTHRCMATLAVKTQARLNFDSNMVHISYLPLPHVMERANMNSVVYMGGRAGFYQGDVLKLLDDMAELKPTIFISAPRLFNRVYDKIVQGVSAAGGLKKLLFDQAYAAKKAGVAQGIKTHALWDALVFSKIRMVLGGNVQVMVSGSAPLSGEVKEFLQIVFGCDVVEGYGLSETAAGFTISAPEHPLGQHVGPPLANVQVRLEDVPEMGYTSNDKPRPRGEVLVRGDTVFSGYYKEPEKTAEAIDKDGWFHTGDIGCWNANGTLSVIDRKKNIFKLSQGEYVAAEKIENILGKSKFVAQLFVYGDSFQNSLVGVVVPDPEVAEAWGAQKGLGPSERQVAKLIQNAEFHQEILEDITRVGKEAQLRGFEFVKKIHLHPDPFSVDAGLITPTFKLKRPQLKVYFKPQIDAMYASMK